ncbi:hypothetical protein [Lysinibacillus sp. LZ02]|uniref:hypothetical protein n=1 Tax=Lysinibacillus sp. LZ02 TaxID=3420668 RepID=UPI003D368AF4
MNITLMEKGEVLATIVEKQVTCDDNKVRECLEALITNHELNNFPPHIDKDKMLKDAIKGFAFASGYELK